MDVPEVRRQPVTTQLREHFHREEVPYSLALIRIVLPLVLLLVVVPRWEHARELFSTDGAPAPLALNYAIMNFPPAPSGVVAVAMMTVLIVSLVTSSLGWLTRPSLLIAFVLYTYLNLVDCLSFMTKYSVISSHLLLLLGLSRCGDVWSIDAWRAARLMPPKSSVWPQRLMQLFIGLVYLGAATTKLHTGEYFTSDQLRFWLMTNVNNANPLGEWLSLYPGVIIAMAHVAIVWQMAFVFVSRRPGLRWIMLGLGVFFHAATAPLLGLFIFPLVMITSYLCFLEEHDHRRLAKLLSGFSVQRIKPESCSTGTPRPLGRLLTSGVAWLILIGTTTVAGVAAEHALDPYGVRENSGPLPLKPVSAEFADRLRSPGQPVQLSDQVLSLDVGKHRMQGVLVDSQSQFQHNEKFYVQVGLLPPHGDLWLECNLHDSEDRLVHRSGQILAREHLRADWQFALQPDLPAGQYWLVLQSAGEEIARKAISLREERD